MRKAEETKQFIIEVTADIFNKQGYVGTSLSDLTNATGLTKGGIYGNFENKNDVAITVHEYNVKRLWNDLDGRLKWKNTTESKLLAYIEHYENHLEKIIQMGGCPLLNTGTDADDTHPDLRLHVESSLHQWKLNLLAILKHGKENGEVIDSVDNEEFAEVFIATIEGGLFLVNVSKDRERFLKVISFLKKQIEGILIK